MAEFDDDFGYIYTDVEAHATSAVNGVSDFSQFYTKPQDQDEEDDSNKHGDTCSGDGFGSDSKEPNTELGGKVSGSEDYSDSDSEDDLNIVLNDNGCKGIPFPISGGGPMRIDEYGDEDDDTHVPGKYVWTQVSTCPSIGKPNESVDMVSSKAIGGDHLQTSLVCDTSNPVVTRNKFGFRLPWYRTILDVDIESFEEKLWRYPGVNITDYFNFDLNEDSWKDYCNSLEQLRQHKSMQYGMPGRFTRETMFKEMSYVGSFTCAPPSSTVSDCRPKGNAIQIEDSIVERQPSFDSRHPRSWDSDVVIQISVQDPTQEATNSVEEHENASSRAHETSENGEFDENGDRNNISYSTTNDDDSSLRSAEANTRKLDRCSQKISASDPMKIDSDDHRNNQVIDVDGNKLKEVNGISLETTEIANELTESLDRNTFFADQCMMETKLSLSDDDDDQLSLISSCFESDSEASKNSVHSDPEDMHTPLRPLVNSYTEPHKSVTSFKNSKNNSIKRKRVDAQDYSIFRSYSQKKHSHQARMLDDIDEPCNHRKKDDDRSPTSDTDDPHNRSCLENFGGRKDRLRDSGGGNIEDGSNYKEPKFSCHYGIRYAVNHDQNQRDNRNYSSTKGSHQFQERVDPYVKRSFSERQTFCGDRNTEWNHFGRAQFAEERSPLPSRESRGLHSRYSSTIEERDAKWSRNSNKLLFKKMPNYKWHEDDFLGEKAGRCPSFTGRKRNNFDDFDGRQLPPVERELSHWGRRGRYTASPIYLDDSHAEKFEDEYCKHRERRYFSHQSYREFYTADEQSWNDSISPRNVPHPRTTDERYWRHVRRIDANEANDINWFDDHYDAYEIEDFTYPNDHLRLRRSNWRSEVMHWTEDHGNKLYSEKASLSCRKYVRREKFHAKYGPLRDGMPIDNLQPEQHRLIMPRKGLGANFIDKSSKIYRSKHEQTVRCRDSVHLAVREQKIPARYSKARISKCSGRPESKGAEIDGECITSGTLQSSESKNVRSVDITQNVGWDRNNKKGHHICPVTAKNTDLNIEKGQIVTQEQDTAHPSQRKHCSDHTAPAQIVKKRLFDPHNTSSGNKVVEGYDKQRILQTMAKMEQRGERFKEPITLKKEQRGTGEQFKESITLGQDNSFKPEVDPMLETAEEQQHRPPRKRRWGGRFPKNDSPMLGVPLKARF